MRIVASSLALFVVLQAASCGGSEQPAASRGPSSNAPSNNARQDNRASNTSEVGVVSSHGGGGATAQPGAGEKPPVETAEFDAKIQKAEAKAKAAGASAADRKAAADAYFSRADFFRDAGDPRLYRFALRDYRIGLRYDSTNRNARAKMDEIVAIYESMGRPVPTLGNEPQ